MTINQRLTEIEKKLAVMEEKLTNHLKHHFYIEVYLLAPMFIMLISLILNSFLRR